MNPLLEPAQLGELHARLEALARRLRGEMTEAIHAGAGRVDYGRCTDETRHERTRAAHASL